MTRFNVRFAHSPASSELALSLTWISERVELFEKYCLPSVRYQSVKPDLWIIWLDAQSPRELRERAALWQQENSFIRLVYIGAFDTPVAVETIQALGLKATDWLLTSRLDNDDALHPRFIEVLRQQAAEGRREFLNVKRGLIVAGGKCYRKAIAANSFIAFSEPNRNPKTVWAQQHGLLGTVAPVRQLSLQDGWIQIVHGGNLSNTVRGWRVPASWLDRRCLPPALSEELRDDGWAEVCADNTIGLCKRYAPAIANVLRERLACR